MKFDANLREYTIQTTTKDKPGNHLIVIKLTDEQGQFNLYTFNVMLQLRAHSSISQSSETNNWKKLKKTT